VLQLQRASSNNGGPTPGHAATADSMCSRGAVDVSLWGILWHSVSDLAALNLLKGKLND
jgi:hypothetical protein